MKRFAVTITILQFFLVCTSSAQNFWQPTNGPFGGAVINLTVDSLGRYYATTWQGIFVSTDQGTTWKVMPGSEYVGVLHLAINSSGYVGGTWWQGVVTSSDGKSWELKNSGLIGSNVTSLVITRQGTIIASTFESVTHRSTDWGITWVVTDSGKFTSDLLVLDDNTIISATGGQLNKSTDDGVTWTNFSTTPEIVEKVQYKDSIIFILTSDENLYRSTDNGRTWTILYPEGNFFSSFTVLPNGALVAGTRYNKIFRSTNNGNTWVVHDFEGAKQFEIDFLEGTPEGYLFLSPYSSGIFRSTDEGMTWTHNGFNVNTVNAVATNANNDVFCGTNYKGVFYSNNQGNDWIQNDIDDLFFTTILSLAVNSSGDVFAGTDGDGIIRSYDNGRLWYYVRQGIERTHNRVYSMIIDRWRGDLYAGTNVGVIYHSLEINNGSSWQRIAILDSGSYIRSLAVGSDSTLFAVTSFDRIYRVSNGGNNIENITESMESGAAWAVYVSSTNRLYVGGEYGVSISTDNGSTWSLYRLPDRWVTCFVENSRGHIFAGASYYGVYKTTDEGATWAPIVSGLEDREIYSLAIDRNDYLYAGTDRGVYRSLGRTTSVEITMSEVPKSFSLFQNYPNPFNPSTVIRYEVPVKSYVTLKVYNVLGQEVGTVVNEVQDAGYKLAEFHASRLPSGVYYYRMTAVGQDGILSYTDVKKMLLLK